MTSSAMLDVRGMRCPWPALRVARLMRESDRIDVLIDDDFAIGEITALAASQGWTQVIAEADENSLISLEKAALA